MADITFTSEVKKIIYENNGYYVFVAEPHIVTGNLPFPPVKGKKYKITGHFVEHKKYGQQIKLERCDPITLEPGSDKDRNGVVEYIVGQKIKGIGRKLAETIYDAFEEKTLDVLDNHPEQLRFVSGIGNEKYKAICEAWKENRGAARIAEMANQGISYLQAVKIYRLYGEESMDKIKENPYRLIHNIEGFGFKTADEIAIKIGILKDSPLRIREGFAYVIDESSSAGHCYLPVEELIRRTSKVLEVEEYQVRNQIDGANYDGIIAIEEDRCWVPRKLTAEISVAKKLIWFTQTPVEKFSDDFIKKILDRDTSITYEDSQIAAITRAVNNNIFILTGGPGTGKSTVSKAILDILEEKGLAVLLASPTGRAAKRLSEATGRDATTIHRMLKYIPRQGFTYNRFKPLDCDAVLIDEASMIDINLMEALLDAIPLFAKVIFVGDCDQLPSVGPGNVFRDMIDSGTIPVGRLTTIHRQKAGSKIIELAHDVNHGKQLSEDFADNSTDVSFVQTKDPQKAADLAVEKTRELIKTKKISLNDFQVLCPMIDRPVECGMAAMNARLQEELNKDGKPIGDTGFRVGDKVMQLKNNYDKDVFNGDVGFIAWESELDHSFFVKFIDREKEKIVNYTCMEAKDQLRLSYACTVHKSQGAEYPYVILIFENVYYKMMTRNLLYTAITRSSKNLFIYGDLTALNEASANNKIEPRYTWLRERLVARARGTKKNEK